MKKFSHLVEVHHAIHAPKSDGTIVFADQGVGIPAEVLPRLFKFDERVTTLGTKGEKGTGFGLPYYHDLMAAMGGELAVESTLGKGATFHARLPVVNPRVLVVDDQSTVRGLIRSFLQKVGIEVDEAQNGQEALKISAEKAPPT